MRLLPTIFTDRLTRFFTRRGYGVQSPFAYHMVRDVIVEKTPYFAYENLEKLYSRDAQTSMLRLLFRLSNALQPSRCLVSEHIWSERLQAYLSAGCHKTLFTSTTQIEPKTKYDFFVSESVHAVKDFWPYMSETAGTFIVALQGQKEAWNALCESEPHLLIFDLKKYGLILRKPTMASTIYYL